MILTYTDFGSSGPYGGQMHAVLAQGAPNHRVVDLMEDAPRFNPKAAGYLLASLMAPMPPNSVVVAVVDPDVGGARLPIVLRTEHHWMVGPDNGLLELVRRHSGRRSWRIDWRPEHLSSTFHGRDLFAPVAVRLALGLMPDQMECVPHPMTAFHDWPDDLAEVIYIDPFGNAVTGWRGEQAPEGKVLKVGDVSVTRATRFGDVPLGTALWYVNSMGLVEIAVNGGSATQQLGLGIGSAFRWE